MKAAESGEQIYKLQGCLPPKQVSGLAVTCSESVEGISVRSTDSSRQTRFRQEHTVHLLSHYTQHL